MKKKMILVAAPPACGKNAVSDRICRGLGHAAYFDKDDFAGLVDLVFTLTGREQDLDGAFYRENVKEVQYETLFCMRLAALKYEDRVLLNAPFAKEVRHPEEMKKLREKVRESGADLTVVWVLATPEICHERMEKRNAGRDRKKLADWENFVKTLDFSVPMELVKEQAVEELLVVDTTDRERFEKTLAEAVRKIGPSA